MKNKLALAILAVFALPLLPAPASAKTALQHKHEHNAKVAKQKTAAKKAAKKH